ncbi:pentapeptide repeat-containing protein [Brasilonema sp. CT11]|nr:pentapeptide repeat-containing protein [Brasilonema sp. CT11]
MNSLREKLADWGKSLVVRRKLLMRIAILFALIGAIAAFAKLYPFEGIGEWTGIGKDSNKSETIEAEFNPKTKEIIKLTYKETENFQSAKTLWDWLLFGGAIAIPFALFYFERREQRRSEKRTQEEGEIADNNLREQALEAYIDRMSELLIDKQLKELISKELKEENPEYQKRDVAIDIARVRTLSVLRRLNKDGERKGSIIRFLMDAELISHLDLNGADLGDANLRGVNLRSANLRGANLIGADLSGADLSGANLFYANLSGAKLSSADLGDANLSGANLSGAKLRLAKLRLAKLSGAKNLTPDQIKSADNWEKANYNKEFLTQLGLPLELED